MQLASTQKTSFDDATLQTLEELLSRLDISTMKLGIERIQTILEALGNPQEQLPMVHIAGTNGKGSVSAMLSAVLKAAGYKVGTFTSPHLVHVRERIALNGNPILSDDFQYEVESLKTHLEQHKIPQEKWPTFFEFINIVAYRYFQRKNVDITVFETGLGGRLDSTNVVKHPNLTVITSIGMDHMGHLGNTLSAIASEKAGILKVGTPVVIGPNIPDEALNTILDTAKELDVSVTKSNADVLEILPDSNADQGLHVQQKETKQNYWLSLLGPYQKNNLATVLACVQQLREQGFQITESHVREGLKNTQWPVRFQYFKHLPLILDGSHNEDGFQTLTESLKLYFRGRPVIWILSLRNNRSPEMLNQLLTNFPQTLGVVLTSAEPKRLYHEPSQLGEEIIPSINKTVSVFITETPIEALEKLKLLLSQYASQKPLAVVTGSLYTAGAFLELL
jgi:dihydrofolate synthase/folylpolyglutamate synthase